MSDTQVPESIAGGGVAPPAASETVAAGAMHPSGGNQGDPLGHSGMQFLAAGGLQVEFVDLTRAASGASDSGPISFADWQPSGTSVPAAGFDAAANQAAGTMLADFATGGSNGVTGATMQPDGAGRIAGARFGDSGAAHPARILPPHHLP